MPLPVSVLQLRRRPSSRPHYVQPQPVQTGVRAALLLRDNLRNRRTIELAYLDAFAHARHDVLIANAYFLPGKKFRDALRDMAERGVRVRLLLQGRVEYRLQHYAKLPARQGGGGRSKMGDGRLQQHRSI